MSTTTRSRRFFSTTAATLLAMAVVTGCGGVDVTDPNAAAANSATQTETGTDAAGTGTTGTDTTIPGTTGTDATVPGAGAAPGTDTTIPGTTGTAGQTGGQGGKGTAGNGTTTGGATGAAAVENIVKNSAIFGGTAACRPATLSPVNIGNVSTLSGVLGELLGPVKTALQTFVASQNACGGLNGHKINFFIADDQGDPSTAASKVQELVQKNKVIAFVGNIQVLTIDGIIPTINRLGVPLVGGDITNNTWFTNKLAFPQGPGPQAVSYGHLVGAVQYHKKTRVGNIVCIEVPRACEQINRAVKELAPKMGAQFVMERQVSITQPSYVSECLALKNANVEALIMSIESASMARLASSCSSVGYYPKLMAYPLSLGNEKHFLGPKWLANTYVPNNVFPWMGNNTPAEKYFQAMMRKYSPGVDKGGAQSLGWTAGAMLVAASANLSPANPTTQQLLDTLWLFQGQKFTELGGLSGPKFFYKDKNPRVPYCLFAAVSNADNSGWNNPAAAPTCTNLVAPSDPQAGG
ncbi:MAG TPA: ABC transporter substrate-binding protein [Sporichthya sp.]|nr:ABC transporter substrate-binding protein [Sporichthya sp.]